MSVSMSSAELGCYLRVVRNADDDTAAWLIARCEAGNATGMSSNAMVSYAIGIGPNPLWNSRCNRPHDKGDLGRCKASFDLAPPEMQDRMRPILETWTEEIEGG